MPRLKEKRLSVFVVPECGARLLGVHVDATPSRSKTQRFFL
jgi:hypothetical protein